jgi:hypothetical protein
MEIGLAPSYVVVGARLATHVAQPLAGWQLVPHGNAGDRGAGDRRPR